MKVVGRANVSSLMTGVTVDHDLIPGRHEICPNCRLPILEGEKDRPEYEENFSCVRCYHRLTDERRAALAERRKQQALAQQRNDDEEAA